MNQSASISTMRLYGAAIAIASGGYSVAVSGVGGTTGATLMLVLGAVVVLHGAVLLTDWADRLGDASGPLMLAYSVLMLANQAWMGMQPRAMMDGGTGMMANRVGVMGWDPGMVTLALLMLASGVIMTVRSDMS